MSRVILSIKRGLLFLRRVSEAEEYADEIIRKDRARRFIKGRNYLLDQKQKELLELIKEVEEIEDRITILEDERDREDE